MDIVRTMHHRIVHVKQRCVVFDPCGFDNQVVNGVHDIVSQMVDMSNRVVVSVGMMRLDETI